MKTGYQVCDAMTKKPVVVSADSTVEESAKVMNKHRVGSVLVNEENKLVGIITDQDIVRKVIAKGLHPKEAVVKKHMSKNLVTIAPEKDIFEAINLMANENVKQLPVMDGRKMIGIITQKDILKLEPELFDLLADKLEVKEEEHKPHLNEGICQECGKYEKKLITRNDVLICKECNK